MKLRTENLVKKYGQRTVVKDVDIEVEQGQIVGLLGPNGAGKTTTFYMVVGLIKPYSGKVYLDEKDISSLPMYKRAQIGIGYLAQEASVFRQMSVEDNIYSVMQFKREMTEADRRKKLEELLDEFGLQHVRKSKGASVDVQRLPVLWLLILSLCCLTSLLLALTRLPWRTSNASFSS